MTYETIAAVFHRGYQLSQFDSERPAWQAGGKVRLLLWTSVLFAKSTTIYAALLGLHYYWA